MSPYFQVPEHNILKPSLKEERVLSHLHIQKTLSDSATTSYIRTHIEKPNVELTSTMKKSSQHQALVKYFLKP